MAVAISLYKRSHEAFPDFTPEIHWQRVDGDVVTTFKSCHFVIPERSRLFLTSVTISRDTYSFAT